MAETGTVFLPAKKRKRVVAAMPPFLTVRTVCERRARRAMSVAFEDGYPGLDRTNGPGHERDIIAVRIIELPRRDERGPKRLCVPRACRPCPALRVGGPGNFVRPPPNAFLEVQS